MRVRAYGGTHPGQKRAHNEDSYLVDEQNGVFVVADGMGGHNAGEVASRMVVDEVGTQARSLAKKLQAMGRWDQIFERAAPLHVEIGSGNGFWITHMAGLHPEHNWLGVEIRFKRVVLVARKLRHAGVSNARIVRYDAFMVDEILPDGSVDGLYVNHPDPWPKDRHHKHKHAPTNTDKHKPNPKDNVQTEAEVESKGKNTPEATTHDKSKETSVIQTQQTNE